MGLAGAALAFCAGVTVRSQTSALHAPITILCSTAVESVLHELEPAMSKASGRAVDVSCSLAASVAKDVLEGATFDVLVLTPTLVEALEKEGRIDADSRTPLGRSPVALAQRAGLPPRDTRSVPALRAAITSAKSVAFAKEGASGTLFVSLLQQWGLRDALSTQLRPLGAGAAVAHAVASGEVELGVLPVSEILPSPGVAVAGEFPAELNAFVAMEGAVRAGLPADSPARRVLAVLTSPEGRRTLAQHGFRPQSRSSSAPTAPGVTATVDTDERQTEPVPLRYIHGVIPDDAKFQILLPDRWNGKLVIFSRGFSGTELTGGNWRTTALEKGYAYAASDEGWNRLTITREPEDSYYESRQRIHELTLYSTSVVTEHYGRRPTRTLMIGGSNGGHHTKWMLESHPELYDGGIAGYGFNSQVSQWGSIATLLRHYDVIASRIDDIIARRHSNPAWSPRREPLDPPLTTAQLNSLDSIYSIPATLGDGFRYDVGRWPGSEARWKADHESLVAYLRDSMPRFDPSFNPNGGSLTDDELRRWDPTKSPPDVLRELRRLDLTGRLARPLIVMHGMADPIVSPGESAGYHALVTRRSGRNKVDEVLAVYYIPGMPHTGPEFDNALGAQLEALEAWIDYRESKGRRGASPPATLAGHPRQRGPRVEPPHAAPAARTNAALPIEETTIAQIHAAYLQRKVTARQVTQAYLDRIGAYDKRGPYLNSLITVSRGALAEADRLDAALQSTGRLIGPLHGIPVILKDNIDTVDMPTTSGVALFKDFVPRKDAFLVTRLRQAGAIVLAKASLSELALGTIDTINSVLPGYTRNPYNTAYASGGSSGGTGVAIAANFATVGVGTDTGSSVRSPASINNLVGIRPTVGLVSRTGVVRLISQRDTPGPMARTVEDAARLLDVMAGVDNEDARTAGAAPHIPQTYTASLDRNGLKGARIGVFRQTLKLKDGADPRVVALFDKAIADLRAAGAVVVDDFTVPGFEALPQPPQTAAQMKADLEASFAYEGPTFPIKTIAELRDAPPGKRVHPLHEVRVAAMAAAPRAPDEDPETIQARKDEQRYRDVIGAAMDAARVDALVYPVWTYPPVLNGDRAQTALGGLPPGSLSYIGSSTQWPVVVVPMGFVGENLPMGFQILGRPWTEAQLIKFAYAYEQRTRHRRPPPNAPPLPR